MECKTVAIKHPNGLHLRVAAKVVEISRKYESTVQVCCKNCPHANACSILQLLFLKATEGTRVTIKAKGPDESKAVKEIAEFFSNGAGI